MCECECFYVRVCVCSIDFTKNAEQEKRRWKGFEKENLRWAVRAFKNDSVNTTLIWICVHARIYVVVADTACYLLPGQRRTKQMVMRVTDTATDCWDQLEIPRLDRPLQAPLTLEQVVLEASFVPHWKPSQRYRRNVATNKVKKYYLPPFVLWIKQRFG